jgi:hypothetical protein
MERGMIPFKKGTVSIPLLGPISQLLRDIIAIKDKIEHGSADNLVMVRSWRWVLGIWIL